LGCQKEDDGGGGKKEALAVLKICPSARTASKRGGTSPLSRKEKEPDGLAQLTKNIRTYQGEKRNRILFIYSRRGKGGSSSSITELRRRRKEASVWSEEEGGKKKNKPICFGNGAPVQGTAFGK